MSFADKKVLLILRAFRKEFKTRPLMISSNVTLNDAKVLTLERNVEILSLEEQFILRVPSRD